MQQNDDIFRLNVKYYKMKRLKQALCAAFTLLFAISLPTYAQNSYIIKGRIVSNSTNIDFANIVLMRSDSSFVNGCIADKSGVFRMGGIAQGSYLLKLSSIGYQTRILSLPPISKNTDLGNLQLDSSAVALKEVVITASHIINTPDKKIVLPSAYQIKSSTNAIELLRQMHLSHLTVDIARNTISSSMPGTVQLRINGAKAELEQVRAIRPEDIIRVEYHDSPSMRYGQDVAAVIDYITKRATHGGYIGLDLTDSPFSDFSDNIIAAKYNHNKSEIGLNTHYHRRNFYGYWRKNCEIFNFDDGTSFTRKEEGSPNKFSEDQIPVSLYYNYQEGKKWFFNASFHSYYMSDKMNTISKLYPATNPDDYVDMKDLGKEGSLRPSLDLYFQRNYKNRQYLILDVVGTYIRTHNKRDYNEWKQDTETENIYSNVKGNKYSIIAEAIYSKGFGKANTISFGANYYQSYTNNKYDGTVKTTTAMHENTSTAFIEWKGQPDQHFNYSLGARLSYFYTQQADNDYHKTVIYPQVKLGYNFSDKLNLSYSGSLAYNTPNLADLSNVSQIIDSLQIRRGNPDLKVSHTWSHIFDLGYQSRLWNIDASVYYKYQGSPVMEETLRENNKFIRTTSNQISFQMLNPDVSIQFGPIKNILTLSFEGGMKYFDSKGQNYHHHYTNWYCKGSLTAAYKNFIFTVDVHSHENRFYGETLKYGENFHVLSLKYKYKDMSFGVLTLNPFVGRNSYNRPTENWSRFAPSYNTWYLRESSHLYCFTFSWNINFGRKYHANRKQLNNSDTDSGTMRNSK